MVQNKAELRQQLKQARLAMTQERHRQASEAIAKRLKSLPDWPAIKNLHYFEPIRELSEPNIGGLVAYLEDSYPSLKLCTPRLINGTWEVVGVHGGKPPEQFDAVLVPMLGFDPVSLHRIGYGGGYYDRFLAVQPQARKIGVCFEHGRLRQLPAQSHDIPLDLIVTEDAVYPITG